MNRPRYRRPASGLHNRNVAALSGRTSLRLESEYWDALSGECAREGLTPSGLVRRIEGELPHLPRTSAVRVWLLTRLRERVEAADRTGPLSRASVRPAPPLSHTPSAGVPDAPVP